MESIDKLRSMVNWFDMQSEYFNFQFKTLKQLELIYDFAMSKGYEFLDDDHILNELSTEEYIEARDFIKKVLKLNK